jgi:hypothetical protein
MSTGMMARLMICQGMRTAPLCWLDIATRCKVPAICRAHDRSAEKSADLWVKRAEKKREAEQ